jgi:hypothetical protein
MNLTRSCWVLVICGTLSLQGRAQNPETIPTLPPLPVVIDVLPPILPDLPSSSPPPASSFPPPLLQPREIPDHSSQREGREPPSYSQDVQDRLIQLEKLQTPNPAPPTTSWATPPSTFSPESAQPVRIKPTIGHVVDSVFHPFRPPTVSYHASERRAGPISQVEMAAATIKASELDSERRLAAVRYLAGIDCTFNPEAEAGLLAALRNDRHESVRYEAALALSNSCCWTKKTVDALNQAMVGGTADGNPAERSDRVRRSAWQALSLYAAAVNPQQPQQLPTQVSAPVIRRTSAETQPPPRATGNLLSVAARSSPTRTPTPSSLAPLRPIGVVPEVEPQTPTYEPTPLQTSTLRRQ